MPEDSWQADYEACVGVADTPYTAGLMPFDNTNGFAAGLAFANVIGDGWRLTFRDEPGVVIITTKTITLDVLAHTSFSLEDRYPELAGRRGTISFGPVIGLSSRFVAVGFRFNPTGPFTTIQ